MFGWGKWWRRSGELADIGIGSEKQGLRDSRACCLCQAEAFSNAPIFGRRSYRAFVDQ